MPESCESRTGNVFYKIVTYNNNPTVFTPTPNTRKIKKRFFFSKFLIETHDPPKKAPALYKVYLHIILAEMVDIKPGG